MELKNKKVAVVFFAGKLRNDAGTIFILILYAAFSAQ